MRSPLGVLTTRGAFPCAGNNEKRARGRERGERGKIVATYQIERSSESQHDLPLLFPRPPSRPTFAIHRFIAHTHIPSPTPSPHLPTSPLSFFLSLSRALSLYQSILSAPSSRYHWSLPPFLPFLPSCLLPHTPPDSNKHFNQPPPRTLH